MAKKAKWLEGTTLSIASAIVAALSAEEVTEKEIQKALKGAQEIEERVALDEAEPTVLSLLAGASAAIMKANEAIDQAGGLYQSDLEAAGVNESSEEDEDSEEDEAPVKEEKKPKRKGKNEDKEPKVDFESMSKKALRTYAKEAGIKTNKKMEKEDLIEAIKAAK
jgi:hypothetical protein